MQEVANSSITMKSNQPPLVPEPSSLVMFGIGALGLFGYSRRRRQTLAAACGTGYLARHVK